MSKIFVLEDFNMARKTRGAKKGLLRLSAALLTFIMLAGMFPFAVLAEDTVKPVADAYVSSADPTAVYGGAKTLSVDGDTADEKIAFLTYEKQQFAGKDTISLTLPVTVKQSGLLKIYLIDGYAVDEGTLCYRNMPSFGSANFLQNVTANSNGDVTLTIPAERITGDSFTLAICAEKKSNYTASENFDAIPLQSEYGSDKYSNGTQYGLIARNSENLDKTFTGKTWSDTQVAIRGANGKLEIVATPNAGDMVETESLGHSLKIPAGIRAKFFGLLKNADMNEFDVGRSFVVSFRAIAAAEGTKIIAGVNKPTGFGTANSGVSKVTLAVKANEWTEFSYRIVVTADMVANSCYMVAMESSGGVVYIDDLTVTEENDDNHTENFDNIPLQTMAGGAYLLYEGQTTTSDAKIGWNKAYSSAALAKSGGQTGTSLQIVPTPKVMDGAFTPTTWESVVSESTESGNCINTGGRRLKLYNLIRNTAMLDSSDLGKQYRITFRVLSATEKSISYGLMCAANGGSATGDPSSTAGGINYNYGLYKEITKTIPANEWTEISFDVTIDQNMIDAQIGMISILETGSELYVDDVRTERIGGASVLIRARDNDGTVCDHVPGNAATANTPQVCTECGEVLAFPTDASLNTRYTLDSGATWIYTDFITAVNAANGNTAILEVYNNVVMMSGVVISSGDITIRSYGTGRFTIARGTGFNTAALFAVSGGATLAFDKITVDGNNIQTPIDGGGILNLTESGTNASMTNTVVLRNSNVGSAKNGGTVWVGAGATFTMNGGTISGGFAKKGAGVFLQGSKSATATFNMTDGLITSCVASGAYGHGAAVLLFDYSTFNMSGGVIAGNTSNRTDQEAYKNADDDAANMIKRGALIDGAVGIYNNTGNDHLNLSGNAIIRNNTAYRRKAGAGIEREKDLLNGNVVFWRNKYNSNVITVADDFTGSVGIGYGGSIGLYDSPVATANGFVAGTVIGAMLDENTTSSVAKVNADGKIVWAPAVAEIDNGGIRTRYATIEEAMAAAGNVIPIRLLANVTVPLPNVGDSVKIIENGFEVTVGSEIGWRKDTETVTIGAFSKNGYQYEGVELPVVTYTAETGNTITDANMVVGSDLTLNFYARLFGDISDVKLRVTKGTKSVLLDGVYVEAMNKYRFAYTGITPQCIGDTVTAELVRGDVVLDTLKDYSALKYLSALLGSNAETLGMTKLKFNALKTVVNDLLQYGAMAQLYTGYKTTELVNEGITASPYVPIETNPMKLVTNQKTEGVAFRSAGLRFSNVNNLYFKFTTPDVSVTTLRVGGKTYTAADFTLVSDTTYIWYTDDLTATQFDDEFVIELIFGDVTVQTLTYSVRTYIYNMVNDGTNEKMLNLAKATYTYGQSAKAYKNLEPVEATTYTVKALVDEGKAKLFGRTIYIGDAVSLDTVAAGMEANLYCLGDISVNFTASEAAQIEITVDGDKTEHYLIHAGTADYVIATGLAEGNHTVRIVQEIGRIASDLTLNSIDVTGFAKETPESELFIEFIGDSITEGCGLYMDGETVYNDATATYAYQAIQALNADYSIAAKGGSAYMYAGSADNNFAQIFPYRNYSKDKTEVYTPARVPNLIVLNLGQNDNWQTYIGTHEYVQADFDANFATVIDTIYATYGRQAEKDIPILFVFGCMENPACHAVTDHIKADLIPQYVANGYDFKQVVLTTDRTGYSSHPSVGGGAVQGAELATFIKENYASLLPSSVSTESDMILEVGAPVDGQEYNSFYVYVKTSDPSGNYYIRYNFIYEYSTVYDNFKADSQTNRSNFRVKTASLVKVTDIGATSVQVTSPIEILQQGEISAAIKTSANGSLAGDFVGGFHGDEWLSSVSLIADGVPVSIHNAEARVIRCNSLIFDQTTMLYEWGTSTETSHGEELAEHKQHFTITRSNGINNRQSLDWKQSIDISLAYLQMFTLNRSACETVSAFDASGRMTGSETVTETITKDNTKTILSNLNNRLVKYSSAITGIRARAGYELYTVGNGNEAKVNSYHVLVRQYGDNKLYVSFAPADGGNTVQNGSKWTVDVSYLLDYVAPDAE